MSRSDNIPATSYWARKKVEFEADAEAGATNSLIRYELMTIAEAVDRPISIQQFSALIKVFDDDVPEQWVGHQLRVLWDSGLLKRKFDEDDKKEKKNPLFFLNEATLEDDFDPSEIDLLDE